MSNIPPPVFWVPGIGEIAFVGYLQAYLVLAVLAAWLYASWWLLHTRVGIYLEAIRHDDMLSATLGIDILKYRLWLFCRQRP